MSRPRQIAAWLGDTLAAIVHPLALLFYFLAGVAGVLLLLCVGARLLEGLHNFLVAPIGIKDCPSTGLAALAEAMVWPLTGAMLVLWAVGWAVGKISGGG